MVIKQIKLKVSTFTLIYILEYLNIHAVNKCTTKCNECSENLEKLYQCFYTFNVEALGSTNLDGLFSFKIDLKLYHIFIHLF